MDERFDLKRLSMNDGKEERPAYIAHGGRVIDVSKSRLWPKGTHMGRHHAGMDLTSDIEAAPHGPEVLERYPQVGTLVTEAAAQGSLPALVSTLLARYPFFRRHPHPASVHFPIVFTFSASFFSVLSMVTGARSLIRRLFAVLPAPFSSRPSPY